MYLSGGGHWTSEMIELSGAIHTLERINIPSIELTQQYVIDSKPDIVILAACGFSLDKNTQEAEKYLFNQQWFQQLIYNKICIVCDGNQYFNRSGPRIIDCFEFLVGLFYNRYDIIPNDFICQHVVLDENNNYKPIYTDLQQQSKQQQLSQQQHNHNNKHQSMNVDQSNISILQRPNLSTDVEQIHEQACKNHESTYTDPTTGYSVFTAYAHLQRGSCCGSLCRHCPYNYANVKPIRYKLQSHTKSIHDTTYINYDNTVYDDINTVSIISFSGGKDSYATLLHTILQQQQKKQYHKIILLTTFHTSTQSIPLQGLSIQHIVAQAQHIKHDLLAIALPEQFNNTQYTQCITNSIQQYCSQYKHINLVYGDLFLYDMLQWRQHTLHNTLTNMKLYFPLYLVSYTQLLKLLNIFCRSNNKPFICLQHVNTDCIKLNNMSIDYSNIDTTLIERYGYKQIIIANTNIKQQKQLGNNDQNNNNNNNVLAVGSIYNSDLLIQLNNNIDLFGENGEFHTYVQFT